MAKLMSKSVPIAVGSVAGLLFAGVTFLLQPRPGVVVFLQAPVMWVCNAIDNARIFPRESLAGLVVVVPLWFGYWICLGGFVGFLFWWAFRRCSRLKSHDDA
jgi:hypothetical protein